MANDFSSQDGTRELQSRNKQTVEREGMRPGPLFRPDVDIVERRDAFVVVADLPGVDARNVEVHLERGVLTLDASLAIEPDPAWTPRHTEYRQGGFHREFQLSEGIDAAGISARMRDGVLELTLPKVERHQARSIEIQAG